MTKESSLIAGFLKCLIMVGGVKPKTHVGPIHTLCKSRDHIVFSSVSIAYVT